MSDISRVGRRKFLVTAGVAATGSVLLKGCVGNPPSSNPPSASTGTPAPGPAAAGDAPELSRTPWRSGVGLLCNPSPYRLSSWPPGLGAWS